MLMQEPLFKKRRTYFFIFAFFALLAFVAFSDGFGKTVKTTSSLSSPAVSEIKIDESEEKNFQIKEDGLYKVFEGEGLLVKMPRLWSVDAILYRPSEPNIILALSNSVDLGGGTSIPSGVIRGKLQLSTRTYATEFSDVSKSDFENNKSSFWKDRKAKFEQNPIAKVSIEKVKYGENDYIVELMKIDNKKEKVNATQSTFYRLVGEEQILAVSWSWEGDLDSNLDKEYKSVLENISL